MTVAIRRIPAPLVLAIAGSAALGAIGLVYTLLIGPDARSPTGLPELGSVFVGSSLPLYVLMIVGLRWLRTGQHDRLALGVRIATWGFALALASALSWQTIWRVVVEDHRPAASLLFGIAYFAATVMIVVGLAIAARTRWAWAVAPLLALTHYPQATLWILDSERAWELFRITTASFSILKTLLTLLLVAAASRDYDPGNAPAVAPRAPRLATLLHMRLAGIALAALAVMMSTPPPELAFAVNAVDLTVCVVLALDLLAAARAELPGWPAVAAAALALWVANVAWARGVEGWLGGPSLFGTVPDSMYELAATCSLACVLVAVALAARRRGLDVLRDTIRTRVIVVVGLALVGGALHGWAMYYPEDSSRVPVASLAELKLVEVISLAAMFAAWLVAARTIRAAAGQLIGGVVPSARVVR